MNAGALHGRYNLDFLANSAGFDFVLLFESAPV